MLRRLIAFAVALIIVMVLGSIAHSLFVQAAWAAAAGQGADPAVLSMGERINWVLHDLVGMEFGVPAGVPPYAVLTGVGLILAFLVAGGLARFTGMRAIVFAVAGAAAMFAIFTALWTFEGTVLVFGARGMWGLAAQMTVGLIAGFVFATMTRPQE